MSVEIAKPERVILVTRMTQLEELTVQFATAAQAKFYLEHAGQDFNAVQWAHDQYHRALDTVRQALPMDLKTQRIDREMVPQFTFAPEDLVIAIGQDGLVSNTAKYLPQQLLIGVNPVPELYDGCLLPFRPEEVGRTVSTCFKGQASYKRVSLGHVSTTDGQSLLAFNDFFIGADSHVSARYEIAWKGAEESQSSSGILVSTGAGSTGWMRSVYQGAAGLISALQGAAPAVPDPLPMDTDRLVFYVREPFPSQATGCDMTYGHVSRRSPLKVRSNMASGGVVFSDGILEDFISFNAGTEITVSLAEQSAHLVSRGD